MNSKTTTMPAPTATALKIEPYLFFNGRSEEAAEFYRRALGAEVTMLVRFKDNPEASKNHPAPPGRENKVMHMSLRIGETRVNASDGDSDEKASFQGFSLTITVSSDEEAVRRFAALAEGGQIHQPLIKTFFASSFGMVADRFGVSWMILKPSMPG